MLETLWQEFLKVISVEVGSRVVETWFKAIAFVRWDAQEKVVYLRAPNHFVKDWVSAHYRPLCQQHLGRLLNETELRIVFVDESAREVVSATAGQRSHVQRSADHGDGHDVALDDIRIAPARLPPSARPATLAHNYVFENFVVGSCNSLAYAAAHAVTHQPGSLYNPLLIWGASGLGKTHLLHAIGNQIKKVHKRAQILYQSTDRFVQEFITAARADKIQHFEARYKSVDVLLLDDIQALSNKEQSQEIFFQIFNNLQHARKQVVCTSSVLPRTMPGFSERIRSRLEGGLVTDLQAAPLETRIAILHKKAKSHDVVLHDDVAHCIATRAMSNIRDLESGLIRVLAFASLTRQPVTLELVDRLMAASVEQKKPNVDFQQIVKYVAHHFDYSVAEIKSPKRNKDLTMARHVAAYLMKKMTERSLRDIAGFLDRRDHSTVMHALSKLEAQRARDASFAALLDRLEKDIIR